MPAQQQTPTVQYAYPYSTPGFRLGPPTFRAFDPPTWCRSFCHVVPQPDLPHHLALPVLAERARYPAEMFLKNPARQEVVWHLLLSGSFRVCVCLAKQRCSVGVGGISGDGLYLTVVVDTHELVKMLRLVVVLVLLLIGS